MSPKTYAAAAAAALALLAGCSSPQADSLAVTPAPVVTEAPEPVSAIPSWVVVEPSLQVEAENMFTAVEAKVDLPLTAPVLYIMEEELDDVTGTNSDDAEGELHGAFGPSGPGTSAAIYIDPDSPIQTYALAHEMFHYLGTEYGISEQAVDYLTQNSDWVTEQYCNNEALKAYPDMKAGCEYLALPEEVWARGGAQWVSTPEQPTLYEEQSQGGNEMGTWDDFGTAGSLYEQWAASNGF